MVDIRMPDGKIVRFSDTLSDKQVRGLIVHKYPHAAAGADLPPQRMPANGAEGPHARPGSTQLAGFGARLKALGAALEDAMPPRAGPGSSFPGTRRQNGNALGNVLDGPTAAEALLRKRLSFLG